jgi:hypothetical protein
MDHKGKATRPAENAAQGVRPPALHHFALARVQELQLLAQRCTASPAKVHAVRIPGIFMRLFFRHAVESR